MPLEKVIKRGYLRRRREFDKKIPFHISRFFPRSRYSDRSPTDISVMKRLYEIAADKLSLVYLGNC